MIAILQFLGTNCELDMLHIYQGVLKKECKIVWHKEEKLPQNTKLVIIPGGFSYGDHLRCGAIAKFAPIISDVIRFANEGGFVFGICNGFQILTECGLLPGALIRNNNLVFKAKLEELEVVSNDNKLLQNYTKNEKIKLPIAHADGNYYIDELGLESLKKNDQILLKYTSDVNGAVERIAGICNKNKNVFGMMPHPERAAEAIMESADGLKMLRDICE